MHLSKSTSSPIAVAAIILSFLCYSCSTPKKITYFDDLPDSGAVKGVALPEYKEPLIQPDDIVAINIETIDPTVNAIVNQTASVTSPSTAPGQSQQNGIGYLVSKEGYVDIPLIGKLKIAGMTTFDAGNFIRDKSKETLKAATVQVRFLNYKITVIGEVNRPATYTIPNERVSVLDAIGLAGDLTIYGKRDNILVIHDQNGKKEFDRIDITSSKMFQSNSFYLHQNDVIYVEPSKAKKAINNAQETKTITIIVSIASVIALIITRIH